MKRFFFANIVLLAAMLSANGQSFFAVSNEYVIDGPPLPPVLDAQGMPLADTNFLAELWGSATPDSLAPLLTAQTAEPRRLFARFPEPGSRFPKPGYFHGDEIVVVYNVPYWGRAWLQVRVWDGRLGATYEQVAARGIGGLGESPLFYGQGGGHPPHIPGDLAGLQSFSVRSVTGVLLRGIRREGSDVIVDWWPGFKEYQLQQTDDLNQPWQNLGAPTGATSVTNAMTQASRFFRVIGFTQ